MGNRLRNAVAFSKERGKKLAFAENERKVLGNRLRNAVAFSKERAKKIEVAEQSNVDSDWAANTSAVLDSVLGGNQGITVDINSESSVKIQMGNNGLFQTSGTVLSSTGAQLLSSIAQELRSADANITIVGHSDNIPVGSNSRFSDNEDLSFARAVSTMQFLRGQGLPAERLSAAGFGASNPIASNATAEGRQQNRRVDIILNQK